MKRFAFLIVVALCAIVVPAQARHASHPSHPSHPAHPAHGSKAKGSAHSCTARMEGYRASGALISAVLTPGSKKDRYDGSVTVDVARANHQAPTGTQTFTLTNGRVRFGKGVSSTAPAAGSRVHLHGKVTVLPHGCPATGFTPTFTVRNVEIKNAA